ncbi:ornithine cyclodeaminase [Nonomuraea jiangxiensis]|uniref:Ornithine cyclodeaminase n=1 Tax=Nonomuraea jiangxiensis TaxID=633440 RepID=A0A1G9BY17_9ACTN|nr:ornithine cyclodeaminase [Nonomuraea jiangxiensis]SDK44361.1 ornithine cyclodeaminase [Nonomuraea jiangxiensis]
MRVLTRSDLDKIELTPAEVVAVVEEAYRALAAGLSDNPSKLTVQPPDGHSVAYSMLGRDGTRQIVAFKTSYNFHPDRRHYYTTLSLYDDRTGAPVALMDCAAVGAMRTPAVSALLARECAAPDSRSVLVVGTGVQGRQALPYLQVTLPGLERFMVYGTHPEGLRAVRDSLPGREVEAVDDLPAAAREADVILAVAGPRSPARIEGDLLRPGALCVLVGYGLAPSTLRRADRVVATSEAQMRVTGTDMADEHGRLRPVDAELPDVLAGRLTARTGADQRIFAYNSGLVITDIALGHHFAQAAEERGLGQVIHLWR